MPAQDALAPGPDGTFPFWPRRADGTTDPERMPRGARRQLMPDGRTVVVIDPAPGNPDGTYAGPPEPPVA